MFNKKMFKKRSSSCSIYKTSSNNEIEKESDFFFCTKMKIRNNYNMPLVNIDLLLVTKLAKQDFAHLYTYLRN